ncbi:hypothetical protein Pcinc_038747 [Petrolisthes cinctipes]|uniref:Uncharacterized protein n=1 Tax=Petrolisthes cinctipes TaxID=88211 RepID=A0AAE1BPU6_PETCI|nr:hypothetical protein Pcinc_038747 [Petrolisthes cinctipes]
MTEFITVPYIPGWIQWPPSCPFPVLFALLFILPASLHILLAILPLCYPAPLPSSIPAILHLCHPAPLLSCLFAILHPYYPPPLPPCLIFHPILPAILHPFHPAQSAILPFFHPILPAILPTIQPAVLPSSILSYLLSYPPFCLLSCPSSILSCPSSILSYLLSYPPFCLLSCSSSILSCLLSYPPFCPLSCPSSILSYLLSSTPAILHPFHPSLFSHPSLLPSYPTCYPIHHSARYPAPLPSYPAPLPSFPFQPSFPSSILSCLLSYPPFCPLSCLPISLPTAPL